MAEAFAVEATIDRSADQVWSKLTTTVLWPLVGPLLRSMMKRTDSGQLEALKAVVEDG